MKKFKKVINYLTIFILFFSNVAMPLVNAQQVWAVTEEEAVTEEVSDTETDTEETETTPEVKVDVEEPTEESSETDEETEVVEEEQEDSPTGEMPTEEEENSEVTTDTDEEETESQSTQQNTTPVEEKSEWTQNQYDSGVKTTNPVTTGETYSFPANEKVSVTFNTLPEGDAYLSIKEVSLQSNEEMVLKAVSNVAYDMNLTYEDGSKVENGTFSYSLTLPNNSEKEVGVKYSENPFDLKGAEAVESEVSYMEGIVKVDNLDHFTVFVVVNPLPGGYTEGNTACPITGADICYDTIQEAINSSVNGDTITVDSSYDSTNETFPITIDKEVKLYGAQANIDPRPVTGGRTGDETVIDGDGDEILDINASNVEINGFTFTNGGGYMIHQNSGVSVTGTSFRYNIVSNQPGDDAVKLRNGSNCTVSYNYINNTNEDAIGFSDITNGTISFNEVSNSSSQNAAIYIYGEADGLVISDNVIHDISPDDAITLGNKGGADSNRNYNALIENNTIYDVEEDGITVYASNVSIDGNEIYNSSSENGAIYIYRDVSNITVTNNNIHDNALKTTKRSTAAGIWIGSAVDTSTVVINDNTIANNTPYGLYNDSATQVDATNNWWGDNDNTGPFDDDDTDGSNLSDNPTGTGNAVGGNVNYSNWVVPDSEQPVINSYKLEVLRNGTWVNADYVTACDSMRATVNTTDDTGIDNVDFRPIKDKNPGDPYRYIAGQKFVNTSDGSDNYIYEFTIPCNGKYHTHDPITEDKNGQIVWFRVRDISGKYSDPHNGVKMFFSYDNTPPDVPTLVSPSDGSYQQSDSLTLDWTDETDPNGPVTYKYQSTWGTYTLDSDNGFTSPKYGPVNRGTSEINGSGSPEREYFWQVRACDSLDNCSDWSGPWSVIVDDTPPTIQWNNPIDADILTSEVNLNVNCDGTPGDCNYINFWWWGEDQTIKDAKDNEQFHYVHTDGTNFQWTLDTNSPELWDGSTAEQMNGTYTLRAAGKDMAGNRSVNDITVTIDNTGPTSTLELDPTHAWDYNPIFRKDSQLNFKGTATDTISNIDKVEYRYSTDGGTNWTSWSSTNVVPTDGAFNSRTEDFSFTINVPEDAEYIFETKATDSKENMEEADYSNDITVNVDTVLPEVSFTATTPSDGAYVKETITVEGLFDATNAIDNRLHNYYISDLYAEGGSPASWCATEGVNVDPGTYSCDFDTTSLTDGSYTVMLVATDKATNQTYGVTRTFIVDNTPPEVPTDPRWSNSTGELGCGSYTNESTATAKWDASTDALSGVDHYEYQSYNPPTGGQWPSGDDGVNVNETTRSGNLNQGEGTYGFRVKAVDAAGNKSDWSATDFDTSCKITYDITTPTVDQMPDLTFEEGTDLSTYDWTQIDGIGIEDDNELSEMYLELKYTGTDKYGNSIVLEDSNDTLPLTGMDNPLVIDSTEISDLLTYVVDNSDIDGVYLDTTMFYEGTYEINYNVTDSAGNTSETKTFTITVNNIAPQPEVTADKTEITEGESVTLTTSFIDPSFIDYDGDGISDNVGYIDTLGNPVQAPDDAPWTASLYWGDGTSETVQVNKDGEINFTSNTHTYTEEGTYTVTLAVMEAYTWVEYNDTWVEYNDTDTSILGDGEMGLAQLTITVGNNEPTVEIDTDPGTVVNEGTTVTLTATVTDGNEPYSGEWSGDCSGTETTTTVSDQPGTYNCTYTATDADGDTSSASVTVVVNEVTEPTQTGETVTSGVGQVLGAEDETEEETEEEQTDETEEETGEVKGEQTCKDPKKMSGYVYVDKNNDGEKNDNEEGLEKVTVVVYYENDKGEKVVVKETDTDKNGYWEVDICPGDYKVMVQEEDLPRNVEMPEEKVKGVSVTDTDEKVNIDYGVKQKKSWLMANCLWIVLGVAAIAVAGLGFAYYRSKKEE